jgi:hypothetical protein
MPTLLIPKPSYVLISASFTQNLKREDPSDARPPPRMGKVIGTFILVALSLPEL